jgi:hypothetical protein
MRDSSYFASVTVDNVLTPRDILENCLTFHTQHNSRLVGLGTIRLLVDPYTTGVSFIDLPHDFRTQCDTAKKLADDLEHAVVQHLEATRKLETTQKIDRGFDKKSQRQHVKLRQRFLEETISLFQMVEDTAKKMLVDAGFNGQKKNASRAKNLTDRVLGQIQVTQEYFEEALRHNQTLSGG